MSQFTMRDLDVFYISYDELNANANWDRILRLHPTAKRVHGVKGFERVYKACAMASTTRRFATIDGDNWVNDGAFEYELDDTGFEDACYSFKSYNFINGLEYGNGGIKIWDAETLLASNTHESSDGTDFCWDIRYYQVSFRASSTVQNCTPYQAWRAGYREGVKMTQLDGKPCHDLKTQWKTIYRGNLSRLHVWCSIGRDVDNGIWAIAGARNAVSDLMSDRVRHTDINDYDWFKSKWSVISEDDPERLSAAHRGELTSHGFYVPDLDSDQSSWFKMVYMNPPRIGLMK